MDRKKLLDTLAAVKPALASTSLIQVLTHFCFADGRVTAYNDQIGLSAPCELDLTGALPGATLLGLLSASRAKEVEITAAESEVQVRAGGARAKLPVLPPDAFLFEMPEAVNGQALPAASKDFISAVRGCLRSVSADTSVPDQLGITLMPAGKKGLDLYSINGATMSRASVQLSGKLALDHRVVLSAPFCEQLVRLAGEPGSTLTVAEDHSMLTSTSGTRLFGKLVDVQHPLDFRAQFADIVPADLAEVAIPVPAVMRGALERAIIFADPSGERVNTRMSVKDGVLSLSTKSGRGTMLDRMKLPNHPNIEVEVDAQWLKVGCASLKHMLITAGAVIFSQPGEQYLIATLG